MRLLLLLIVLFLGTKGFCQGKKRFPQSTKELQAYIDDSTRLIVKSKETGKQLLEEDLREYDAASRLDDTTGVFLPYEFIDVNFDGYEDLLYPSYSGNVQRFRDVYIYIYNPIKKTLDYNETLSQIACLSVYDKSKRLEGTCFHASAAENWVEEYKWINKKLVLIERSGTMPCANGQACYYDYIQKRINGKMVFIHKRKHKI